MPFKEEITHYEDCWRYHHKCAIAKIELMEEALKRIYEFSTVNWDIPQIARIAEPFVGKNDRSKGK